MSGDSRGNGSETVGGVSSGSGGSGGDPNGGGGLSRGLWSDPPLGSNSLRKARETRSDKDSDMANGWKGLFAAVNASKKKEKEKYDGRETEEDEGEKGAQQKPTMQFTAEEYEAWCMLWMNSLIVKLLGKPITRALLKTRLQRMWRTTEPINVMVLNNGYFIVSFTSKEVWDHAYQEGPWMMDDHYLLIQKWRLNFNMSKADTQGCIVAWIRILDLPVEFYSVEALRHIGNMVGKTIKLDLSTSLHDKGGFARICVELDLDQPLLSSFVAFGEDIHIEYEGLHMVCFCCGVYGRYEGQCLEKVCTNLTETIGKKAKDQVCEDKMGKDGSSTIGSDMKSEWERFGRDGYLERKSRRCLKDMKKGESIGGFGGASGSVKSRDLKNIIETTKEAGINPKGRPKRKFKGKENIPVGRRKGTTNGQDKGPISNISNIMGFNPFSILDIGPNSSLENHCHQTKLTVEVDDSDQMVVGPPNIEKGLVNDYKDLDMSNLATQSGLESKNSKEIRETQSVDIVLEDIIGGSSLNNLQVGDKAKKIAAGLGFDSFGIVDA
ncbi:uncharacterized protein LOC129302000 [Prosopis cineraria]|uniref:uncharacterized protein LOC129302000 n=1 Tax=Prosopis cineraria TaxID=364024 RepID=UPI00240EF287|nr:uncharacterized protein LOC129302000 [Prosopis cineraria]